MANIDKKIIDWYTL